MEDSSLGPFLPPIPVPPVAVAPSHSSRSSARSGSGYSRQSLKSLDRLLGDDRDPRKLQKLVHKLYENLKFEKDRADYADRRASEAISYLKSICEEKLRALREISRLEEELKLYKIQYEEAQKEIFRAQSIIEEVDEKRYRAEKEAADTRSSLRKMKDQINVMNAQEEGRREGLQEGIRKGREMGYQEGLKMAQAELENMARVGPGPAPSSSTEARAPARSRAASQTSEPRGSSRHYSRIIPSNAPSRLSTTPPGTPSSPSVAHGQPPLTNQPINPILEVPEEPEIIRPRSSRAPPSPRIPLGAIPPDNFIPHLEEDNTIRIPPPFEFSRPPPSPESTASPTLARAENEEPRMIRPMTSTNIRSRSGRSRRSSSPTSASTTLSHMDMVADPYHGISRTPMSAIQEALSQEGSPAAHDAASLRDQSSLGAQSAMLMASSSSQPIYHHPRPPSAASSRTSQPPVIPGPDLRASASSTSSPAPSISVVPPTTSISASAEGQGNSHSGSVYGNPNTNDSDISFLPPIPETSHPTNPVPLPGQHEHATFPTNPSGPMPGEWGYGTEYASGDNMNTPVIPNPDLYTELDEEEDAVSSGFNSPDSLTTPHMLPQTLPNRAESVRSAGGSTVSRRTEGKVGSSHYSRAGGSRTGSALGSTSGPSGNASEGAYQPNWDEVIRASFRVPLKFPQPPRPDAQSAIGSASPKTLSNKGHGKNFVDGYE